MSDIGQYILTITISATIVSIILVISGGKTLTASYIKLISSLFLTISILSPFIELRLDTISGFISSIDADASAAVNKGIESNRAQKLSLIKEQTEAYLLERAKQINADISVDIDFTGVNELSPTGVTISGEIAPYTKRQLIEIISHDLGIPEDAQKWN